MKYHLALLLCAIFQTTVAQNCDSFSGVVHPIHSSIFGDVSTDGDLLVANVLYNGSHACIVDRITAAGALKWSKQLLTTDPHVWLWPMGVKATPDNGSIVYGERFQIMPGNGISGPYNYTNWFAVNLDSAGNVLWARIYQDHFTTFSVGLDMLALSAGEFVLAHQTLSGALEISWLDSMGVPYNTRILTAGLGLSVYPFDLLEDQSGNVLFMALAGDDVAVVKMDALGNDLWGQRYDFGSDFLLPYCLEILSNGDIVVGGASETVNPTSTYHPGFMKIDSLGTYQNTYRFDTGPFDAMSDIMEQANGDLIMVGENYARMWRTNSSGVPISLLHENSPVVFPRLRSHGDTVYLVGTDPISDILDATVSYDGVDFSCGYTTTTSVVAAPSVSLNGQYSVLPSTVDSIQTWTMSLRGTEGKPGVDIWASLNSTPARPGFDILYSVGGTNIALDSSGPITAVLKFDTVLTYLSSSIPPTATHTDSLVWVGLSPLAYYDFFNINVEFNLPPDTALLGDTLSTSLHLFQDSVELQLANNHAYLDQVITGSYDPNDKLVSPEGVFNITSDSLLNYTIRFQNTGTDTAFNILIVDTLPEEVSVGSFFAGVSTHPYTYELNAQGVLKFHFDNVLLPDSNVNEPLSHGLVNFSIRPDAGLPIGTLISNEADIYFDFNPPVRTPPAVVSYGIVNSVPMQLSSDALRMYPVPVRIHLTIEIPDGFQATEVWVNDLHGREVERKYVSGTQTQLYFSTSGLVRGLYVLSLVDDAGTRLSARFIKE